LDLEGKVDARVNLGSTGRAHPHAPEVEHHASKPHSHHCFLMKQWLKAMILEKMDDGCGESLQIEDADHRGSCLMIQLHLLLLLLSPFPLLQV